jgi:hypothetical protein
MPHRAVRSGWEAPELRGNLCDVPVLLLTRERLQRLLEPRDRLCEVALVKVDLGLASRDARGRMAQPSRLESRMAPS